MSASKTTLRAATVGTRTPGTRSTAASDGTSRANGTQRLGTGSSIDSEAANGGTSETGRFGTCSS